MQIVGYESVPGGEGDHAALRLSEDGALDRLALKPGADVAYSLGERHCAGSIDEDDHYGCSAPTAPYCDVHTDRWACARCTGNCDLPLPTCREEHAVYLAAFAPSTFKVGVTRSWRLETRLREQGADRAAHLRTVVDGRVAREIEADIATALRDRVRVPTKVRSLHESVDEDAWRELLEEYDHVATYTFDYGLELSERPMAETLLTGRVRGTKGRVLVLDTGGSTYAVDLRSLVGHEVAEGASDRELQASLGAFD